METEIKDRSASLADVYSYLNPGALCYCPDGDWLFAAFPFKEHRPGCLIFRGKADVSVISRRSLSSPSSQPRWVPFRALEILRPTSNSLEEEVRDHEQHGFLVLERPVALEDLVERKQLPLRYTHNLEVDVQLHAVLLLRPAIISA
ncbi:hypothetical protein [Acidithiobacillus caldus]|uniref:hypothetical protein n=1 Tax=Acidithiobacillus caldus TaxID=33059 RepID=UPI001C068125|nr:hypothetical protein [Acidithiobacillus caldus]MBU2763987.1 hypothetical protein [Acidithiobacillus caldus]MBU2769687.1 hypothetical protein [Acidithiobacillus caldus]